MQLYRTFAETDAKRHLEITLPDDFPSQRLQVEVAVKVIEPQPSSDDSLQALFNWLETLPPSRRTREEIDAQIAEERNAWGDED
ncbi:hypothetical protein [Pseudothauera hydrothermalis]|uniref:hypothetical protein n=1 Tax=Pseudothauera hydrothermalis TaxID=2184083 RepID=UPI000E092E6B|nr:hypothetical protein [Pseudothauera hydrothermalis]